MLVSRSGLCEATDETAESPWARAGCCLTGEELGLSGTWSVAGVIPGGEGVEHGEYDTCREIRGKQ